MFHTFLAPAETPPTSLQIKRALLTYERVIISDPSDREFFPSQLMMSAMFSRFFGIPFPMGLNSQPVRPLGKVETYDADFDQTMEEISYARREGLVDIVSTYERLPADQMIMGSLPNGGYPLNHEFLLSSYRNIARDQEALGFAISGDSSLSDANPETVHALGGDIAFADMAINGDPILPLIESQLHRPELQEAYTKIGRARIASTMKSVGYCAAKQLVPTFTTHQSRAILGHITARASKVVDMVARDDPHFLHRSRVLDIAHEEYINDDVLKQLSIDDVLRLRTKAWGNQAEARDVLLQSAAMLAQECKSGHDFDTEVRSRIETYRKSWDDLCLERQRLGFMINCDLTSGTLKALAAGATGELLGSITQLQSSLGAATLLLAGCAMAIEKIKELKPARDQILAAEAEFTDQACFGVDSFYRNLL